MNAVLLESFARLQAMLDGHVALVASTFEEPVFERLRSALATPRSRSPLDLAVLIRQALAYENGRRGSDNDATLRLPMRSGWPGPAEWRQVSVDAQRQQDEWHVRTTWWRPDWLPGTDIYPVDQAAMSAQSRQPPPRTQLPTDAFLARVGVSAYRSLGQCRAARAILTAPPGATVLVTLPTGEGKSLLFQLIDRVGFPEQQSPGVTLVIVPTVTLAIDHEKSARKLPDRLNQPSDQPLAYVEDDTRKARIRDAIRAGQQGLCFAAPEAACGPLRSALSAAARAGRLRALVVDEAHIVYVWHVVFLGISKKHTNENPIKHGNRWHTVVTLYMLPDVRNE